MVMRISAPCMRMPRHAALHTLKRSRSVFERYRHSLRARSPSWNNAFELCRNGSVTPAITTPGLPGSRRRIWSSFVTRSKYRPRYNRIVKGPAIAVAVAGLSIVLLSGCKKDIKNDDAVRQGIMNYLSKRPDLLSMDVNVTSVAYRQDEATATVKFQA